MDAADTKVLLLEAADVELTVEGRPVLEVGAPVLWFVFPGQWSDVGRFHRADGTFTGWYTNLCTPVTFSGSVWSITDLFLDWWIPASGQPRWLDQEEFDQAVRSAILSPENARRALAERDRVEGLRIRGLWPPRVSTEWTLESFDRG